MRKDLLEFVQKLVKDEDFRAEFMAEPRKHLAGLGISAEMMERLIPVLLTALTAGFVLLDEVEPLPGVVGWR